MAVLLRHPVPGLLLQSTGYDSILIKKTYKEICLSIYLSAGTLSRPESPTSPSLLDLQVHVASSSKTGYLQGWEKEGGRFLKGQPCPLSSRTCDKYAWRFSELSRSSWLAMASTSPHMRFQRQSMRMKRVWQMPASPGNCPDSDFGCCIVGVRAKVLEHDPLYFSFSTQDPGTMWPSDWTHALCIQILGHLSLASFLW